MIFLLYNIYIVCICSPVHVNYPVTIFAQTPYHKGLKGLPQAYGHFGAHMLASTKPTRSMGRCSLGFIVPEGVWSHLLLYISVLFPYNAVTLCCVSLTRLCRPVIGAAYYMYFLQMLSCYVSIFVWMYYQVTNDLRLAQYQRKLPTHLQFITHVLLYIS